MFFDTVLFFTPPNFTSWFFSSSPFLFFNSTVVLENNTQHNFKLTVNVSVPGVALPVSYMKYTVGVGIIVYIGTASTFDVGL